LYQRRILIGHEDYTLEILDTAGADTQFYQDLHQKWISHGEGFILVYSVTSRSSFLRVKDLHDQIHHWKQPLGLGDRNISSMKAPHIPIILIGNQCDSLERAVSIQEGDALAQEIGCHFVESTAKSCDSAHEIFSHMVRQLRRQSVMLRGSENAPLARKNIFLKAKYRHPKTRQFQRLVTWAKSCCCSSKIWTNKSDRVRRNIRRKLTRTSKKLSG
jgi:GTPase SAR1 family protein